MDVAQVAVATSRLVFLQLLLAVQIRCYVIQCDGPSLMGHLAAGLETLPVFQQPSVQSIAIQQSYVQKLLSASLQALFVML